MEKTIKLSTELVKDLGYLFDGDGRVTFMDDAEETEKGILFTYAVNLPTRAFTKEQYNGLLKFADNILRNYVEYEIQCTYDVSGYDYWSNQMNEDLTIYVDVLIKRNLAKNEEQNLLNDIYSIGNAFLDFEESVYESDENYYERLQNLN